MTTEPTAPPRASRGTTRRRRVGLALGATVAAAGLVVPAATTSTAAAPPVVDYTVRVDPLDRGAAIEDSMYGVFYEDINRAGDGGLYAELVQNRSFEYSTTDNREYTPLTSWTPTATGGTVAVADDAERMNERNRSYLDVSLDGSGPLSLTNSGYNTGIPVKAGQRYDFSLWARTDQAGGTPMTVGLRNATGTATLSAPVRIAVRGDAWTKYSATVTARTTSDAGRLTVTAAGTAPGTVRLDMVSLFPRQTFKDRPNGLRKDLAEKIAALEPGFVRFPGGCIVNTGSHQAYDAENGFPRSRSYQWKDTIGPVETRATNANFWGYNQSYGLGYFEYFQFAEDIGAMPLPVVPALVNGCGQQAPATDPDLLQRHIQDTLDLIEFANGPATSTWGAKRAAMGHPAPFGLTRLGVGNEENYPEQFIANFTKFRDAIKARYPDITVISNSGPDDQGVTFDQHWKQNREAGVDMVDEHYYNDPDWFLQNNDRYDSYDRNGPQVFLGEYASRDAKFSNALAEANFMTGLERNADVVKMASYAPLLANEDYVQWRPDMIWFDNDQTWGSTSYEVQRLFMNNVGDQVVPSRATATPQQQGPITGAIGLSTWATSAAYDDVRVRSADGTDLFTDDFAGGDAAWTRAAGRGSWAVQDGAFVQSDQRAEDTLVTAGDPTWSDYDLSLKATKKAGAEGFLVAFGVKDTGNLYWWNLGGFGNTRSLVEKATGGAKQSMLEKDTTIQTGRTYDVQVKVRGRQVTLYLDGQQWGSFTDDKVSEPFRQVVTHDDATGDTIVKVVNAQDARARTIVDLGDDVDVAPTARMTRLVGDPDAVNTKAAQPIRPRTTTLRGVRNAFVHTFPANSVTFLRIKAEPRGTTGTQRR